MRSGSQRPLSGHSQYGLLGAQLAPFPQTGNFPKPDVHSEFLPKSSRWSGLCATSHVRYSVGTFRGNVLDEPQQPRIFLSYARADRPRVTKIAEALTAAGLSVWWDTAIEGGSAFAKDIARELDAADVVVVIWSSTSVESAWVLDEAGSGRDRKRLVPVQLDATPPPLGFRQLQAVDLSGWRGRAADPKIAALVATIGRVAGSAPVAAAAAPKPRSALRFAPWLIAALVLVAAIGAGWHWLAPRFGVASRPVVAVLPFTDMSEAKGKAYFAEGLAEEILDTLAHDTRLKVLGGTTARAIRDNSANPDFARDKLGVTRLLEGSVRGGNGSDSVKVSVRLIDTADGSEIWSQAFDRSGANVVAVQEEVAKAVAVQLAGPLGGNAPVATASTAKVPPAAYEKVLVAQQLMRTRQGESILQARALATEAVALTPEYALAYATKSRATTLATGYSGLPWSELAGARRDAETAIKLDPGLAYGFTALGGVLDQMNDFQGAIAALTRALTLKPDDSESRFLLAKNYGYSGNPNRAIAELEKAVASDPLWTPPVLNLVQFAGQANQLDLALATAKRFRSVSPNLADADLIDGYAAQYTGDYARSLAFLNAALARNPKLSSADGTKLSVLTSMLAVDHISDAAWANFPPYYRLAYSGDWPKAAAMVQKNGAAAWDDPIQVEVIAYGADAATAVSAFDARFANVAAYLATPFADETGALLLARAFDGVGRAADAKALRNFARVKMTRAEANGNAASFNAVNWATVLAAEGDRAGALTKLERGLDTAWWHVCAWPWIGDQPVLTPLHGDPRFAAVKGRCRVEINKQRKLAGIPPAALK